MLPKLRTVLTFTTMLALVALAIGVLWAPRTRSMFAIGTRSAQGSPIERSLPEPPDWRQFVARAAQRRSQELDRLLDLPAPPEDVAAVADSVPDGAPAAPPGNPTDSLPGAAVAGLADRAGQIDRVVPSVTPETDADLAITGAIPAVPAPANEPDVTLSLPELPEIPDAAASIQQALTSEAAAPPANGDADDRVATIPTTETSTPSVTLPTRARLPPVKPPRTAAPKKPRVARTPAPRQPAATNPAQHRPTAINPAQRRPAAITPAQQDPFANLFGASTDTPPTGSVNQRPKAIKRPAPRPAGQ